MAIIHTTPKTEKMLKEHNFSIPEFPKTGNVYWFNKLVGDIDNFNGLTITDETAIKYIKNTDEFSPIQIWNE